MKKKLVNTVGYYYYISAAGIGAGVGLFIKNIGCCLHFTYEYRG